MATNVGRVRAAIAGIHAVTVGSPEKTRVLESLAQLEEACKCSPPALAPRTLVTLGDYLDAPTGTVVAKAFGAGYWEKSDDGGWSDDLGITYLDGSSLGNYERRVVEWGDL